MVRTAERVIPAPAGLSESSKEAWTGYTADLAKLGGCSAADLELLGDILAMRDRLTEIERRIAVDGTVVAGSRGQARSHPLLAVEAKLRRDIAAGLRRLRLTNDVRPPSVFVTEDGRYER